MPLELAQEHLEKFAEHLEDLAKKLRTGELILTTFTSTRDYERWYHRDKCEHFGLKDDTLTLHFYNLAFRQKEQARKEAFLKEHPSADNFEAYVVVGLNGIPRGACYDYSVEEGWIEYLTPVSGKHEDYSNPDAELELRRYFGKVEILAHGSVGGPNSEVIKIYDSIPSDTPWPWPGEPYTVMPRTKPVTLSGRLSEIRLSE